MTQLFFNSETAGPGTHALVIGVGGYPHLDGGTGMPIEDPLQYGNLGQLTSPPRSALAFADYLYKSVHANWKAPLATIEVLISPAPSEPELGDPSFASQDATIDGIREAFGGWKRRCGSDPHNVAIFYFCGHGLQTDEQILLASDFGRFPDNHFTGAFAFDTTRLGFLQSQPATQCFFIDACREVTPGTVESMGRVTAQPLATPRAYQRRLCEHDLTLHSSAPFEAAFAPPGKVSHFTTALMNALDGAAASTDEYGDWVIQTDGVTSRIDELLQAASGSDRLTAKGPGLAPTVLYRLDEAPYVELILDCDPQLALAQAILFCQQVPPPPGERMERIPPISAVWKPTVKAGFYVIGATFASAAFANTPRNVLVSPPSSPQKLRVHAL